MYNYPKPGNFITNTPSTGFGTTNTTFGQAQASTSSMFPSMQPSTNIFQGQGASTFPAVGTNQSAFASSYNACSLPSNPATPAPNCTPTHASVSRILPTMLGGICTYGLKKPGQGNKIKTPASIPTSKPFLLSPDLPPLLRTGPPPAVSPIPCTSPIYIEGFDDIAPPSDLSYPLPDFARIVSVRESLSRRGTLHASPTSLSLSNYDDDGPEIPLLDLYSDPKPRRRKKLKTGKYAKRSRLNRSSSRESSSDRASPVSSGRGAHKSTEEETLMLFNELPASPITPEKSPKSTPAPHCTPIMSPRGSSTRLIAEAARRVPVTSPRVPSSRPSSKPMLRSLTFIKTPKLETVSSTVPSYSIASSVASFDPTVVSSFQPITTPESASIQSSRSPKQIKLACSDSYASPPASPKLPISPLTPGISVPTPTVQPFFPPSISTTSVPVPVPTVQSFRFAPVSLSFPTSSEVPPPLSLPPVTPRLSISTSALSNPPLTPRQSASAAPPFSLAPVTPKQVPPFTPRQVPPFTPRQIPPFTPRQIPPFTPRQVPPFTPRQIPPFTPRQTPPFTPRYSVPNSPVSPRNELPAPVVPLRLQTFVDDRKKPVFSFGKRVTQEQQPQANKVPKVVDLEFNSANLTPSQWNNAPETPRNLFCFENVCEHFDATPMEWENARGRNQHFNSPYLWNNNPVIRNPIFNPASTSVQNNGAQATYLWNQAPPSQINPYIQQIPPYNPFLSTSNPPAVFYRSGGDGNPFASAFSAPPPGVNPLMSTVNYGQRDNFGQFSQQIHEQQNNFIQCNFGGNEVPMQVDSDTCLHVNEPYNFAWDPIRCNQLFTPQQPSTTTNLFGQNKTTFGFGSPAAQPTNLFGQTAATQPTMSGSSSLFQTNAQPSLFGNNSFGSPQTQQQQQIGTVVKFNPVTGSDTMQKNGVAQSISTKHHSITCMKEYESKSFEELRSEDYSMGRKGPQQAAQTGAFGASTPFGGAQTQTSNLFGQTAENKPGFGQPTGAFGASPFGQPAPAFGAPVTQAATPSLFGKPAFGTPTSSGNTFGFNASAPQNTTLFNANQPSKPFGASTMFGATNAQAQPTFGTTSLFNNSAGTNLFQKTAQPTNAFNTGQQSVFSFNQAQQGAQATPNVFQLNKPATQGFGMMTQANAAPVSAFGTNTGFGTNTFGGGLGQQGTLFTGPSQAKPAGLFSNTTGGGSGGLFPNVFQQQTTGVMQMGLGMNQQAPSAFPSEPSYDPRSVLLSSDPFPDAPHFKGLTPVLTSENSTTNQAALNAIIEQSKISLNSTDKKLHLTDPKSKRSIQFAREFFDTHQMLKTSHKCLVIKEPKTTTQTFYGKYENELIEFAAQALARSELSASSATTPTVTPRDESNDGKEKKLPVQRLIFDTTAQGVTPAEKVVSAAHLGIDDEPTDTDSVLTNPTNAFGISKSELSLADLNSPDTHRSTTSVSSSSDMDRENVAGVILTRPGYYTIPALKDLGKYMNENDECIVQGFTVGRRGYGNVHFSDPINVRNLNLDEIVSFRYREVNIYPKDELKPPIGEGLNRPAQVTLDRIYPMDKVSKTYIKDANVVLNSDFVDKLIDLTIEKKKCEFVDYRPETGSWVFRVKHFSKYKYTSSDEEGCNILADSPSAIKKVRRTRSKTADSTTASSQVSEGTTGYDEDSVSGTGTGTGTTGTTGTGTGTGTGTRSETSGLGGMSSSINLDKAESVEGMNLEDVAYDVDNLMDQERDNDDNINGDYLGSYWDHENLEMLTNKRFPMTRSFFATDLLVLDENDSAAIEAEENAVQCEFVANPKVHSLGILPENMPRMSVMKRRCYTEMSIFNNANFRVGWGPGFKFFNLRAEPKTGFVYIIDTCQIESTNDVKYSAMIPKMEQILSIVLKESTASISENKTPTFTINENLSLLRKMTELFEKHVESNNLRGKSLYLLAVMRLCTALWGNDGNNSICGRRQQLSDWLKQFTNELFTDFRVSNDTSAFGEIFELLTFYKVHEAAELANERNLDKLSLLIAQLSANEKQKFLVRKLVDDFAWQEKGVIPDDFKQLYLLLAGLPLHDGINTCENLDWLRTFGLHLWYFAPAAAPIKIAFEAYRNAFEEPEEGYAMGPVPRYSGSRHPAEHKDLLYNILALYINSAHQLCELLHPETHTANLMDYRMSWVLLQVFLSLKTGLVRGSELELLHTTFSTQLEQLGLWKWAVFVLLFLEDDVVKRDLVAKVLHRHLGATREEEDELVTVFRVPAEWVHEVKAVKAGVKGAHFEEYGHLVRMERWQEANSVLVEAILPELFINGQYAVIVRFVEELRPMMAVLSNWENQAGIFDDFIHLYGVLRDGSEENEYVIVDKLISLVSRSNLLAVNNIRQKLCVSEISRKCALLFNIFSQRFQNKELMECPFSLNMPADYRFFEIHESYQKIVV